MSRRKQSKPQQHLGVEANDITGISAPKEPIHHAEDNLDTDDNMHLDQKDEDVMDAPDSASEVHICTNCQGEFIGTDQFLQHQENCNQKQVVLIMNEHKDVKEDTDGNTDKNRDDQPDSMDSHEDTMERISPLPAPPSVTDIEDGENLKVGDMQQRPIDFSTQSGTQNENVRPTRELSEMLERLPATTSSGNDQASTSQQQQQVLSDITTSHANLGGKRNGMVKPSSLPSSIAVIQEQLYTLHQQHLQQMQIILQIQEKIQALVAESCHRDVTTAAPAKENAAKIELPTIIKPPAILPTEASLLHSKPQPHHPSVPSTLQILQNQVRQTPSLPFPTFPLPSPHSPFDLFPPSQPGLGPITNPLSTPLPYPGGLLSHRKGKAPNVSVFDPKFTDDAFFRHKCHFCHKVFGSDSALQIHIRSHTGERPFRCNICGNRFSTKGNLKVHFQRHQAQYPDVEMDITPYPPSPIPQDQQPLQPPSIDQVPMPSIPNEAAKPSSAGGSALPPQEELPSFLGRSDAGEINNNEKASDIQKAESEEEKQRTESMMETAECGESCRPSSAPSKVITSTMSPSGKPLAATARDDVENEGNGSSGGESSVTTSSSMAYPTATMMEGDLTKSSETSKLQDLVESIEQKITEPNQCVICHKVLSCKNALQLHYRIHTGERPFRCKICGRTFTTKGNLKTHYSVHKSKQPPPSFPPPPSLTLYHECPICQKGFANPILLQQHLKLHAAEDLMMHTSPFNQESYFREENGHERGSGGNLMESLQARFNYMRGELAVNGERDRRTDLTRPLDEEGEEMTAAKRQKMSEMDGISSTLEEKDMDRPFQLVQHSDKLINEEVKNNLEGVCDIDAPNMDELKLVQDVPRSHSEGALDLTPKATSSSPDSVRSDPLALTTSAQDYSRIVKSEVLKSAFQSGKSSPDSEADLKPYTNGEMRQIFDSNIPSFLMGRHRNRSNTTCYFCGKTFACASALNIHYRSHTKERPFKCDVCCKGFSTRGNLKQHMLTHKIRDMPSQLLGMDHMKAMNNGANNNNNGTDRSEALSGGNHRQVQAATRIEEATTDMKRQPSSRHQCHICDKQFQSDSALQIHVRTHTGEKPFKCHICGRAFTTKGNMKVHLGTHMWNGGSRRGRRITMDPPLIMAPKDSSDLYRSDLFSSGFRPGLDYPFFHYPPPHHPLLNGFAPLGKPNEISVIQNPHNLSVHYPPQASDSSLVKNGSVETFSNGYSRSNSSGGSGHSSPDKKSYSPSAELEHPHLLPSFPPSSQASAMNYLNLVRLSRGSESSGGRASPDMPPAGYMMPETSRPGILFPQSNKPSLLPNGASLIRESPLSNHIRSTTQSLDAKTSIYDGTRPAFGFLSSSHSEGRLHSPLERDEDKVVSERNHIRSAPSIDAKTSIYDGSRPAFSYPPSSESHGRLHSPLGHEDEKSGPESEVRAAEDSLTSATRMVEQLQSQRS